MRLRCGQPLTLPANASRRRAGVHGDTSNCDSPLGVTATWNGNVVCASTSRLQPRRAAASLLPAPAPDLPDLTAHLAALPAAKRTAERLRVRGAGCCPSGATGRAASETRPAAAA